MQETTSAEVPEYGGNWLQQLYGIVPGERRTPWYTRDSWFRSVDYRPYAQQAAFHASQKRFRIYMAGKRTGKSMSASKDVENLIMTPGTVGWFVGVTYERAEKEFLYTWDDIVRGRSASGKKYKMHRRARNTRGGDMMYHTSWDSVVKCISAKDPENIESEALDWFVLCEPAQHKEESWELLRSRVSEKRGIGIFSGTPPPANHWLKRLFDLGQNPDDPEFESWRVSAEACPFPGYDECMAMKRVLSDYRYRRDVLAEFVATDELIYPTFDYPVHMDRVPYRKGQPLYLGIDVGFSNPYVCLWAQTDGDSLRIVDEYYERRRTEAENADAVVAQHKERFGDDMSNIVFAYPDPHSPSAIKELKNRGIPCTIAGGCDVPGGIELVRQFLEHPAGSQPRLVADYRCEQYANEMTLYHNKKGKDEPAKEDDHCPDALRYMVLNLFGKAELGIRSV